MANERARALRKTMTPQEARLWLRLRALREQGLHFRRQVPLKGYILDFACLSRRVIVEADGNQHGFDVQARHDAARDAAFARDGFLTLRFSNHEINRDPDGVADVIFRQTIVRPVAPHPVRCANHPPHEGEGEGGVSGTVTHRDAQREGPRP